MVEVEELSENEPTSRSKPFGWLLSTLIQPARAMHEISHTDRPVWLIPVLLLTILSIISALVAGPLRQQAAMAAGQEPPPSFEYMTPEQQEEYMQAQQNQNGPATTILFPAIGSLVGIWLGWVLLGSILHLVLTMLGSRSTSTTAYNLAAWASLPFAVRLIVQIIAMLSTHQLISSPGLSGFIAADTGQALLYARILLRLVDLYLIWQIVLLTIGAASTAGLARGKAFSGVIISVVLLLVLSALPGFLTAQFSSMNVTQPFIFF